MAKEIRVRIPDTLHQALIDACKAQECTQSSIVTEALTHLLTGNVDTQIPLQAISGQNLRIMEMLEHLMKVQGCWPEPEPVAEQAEAVQEEPHETLPDANGTLKQYTSLYGEKWLPDPEAEAVPDIPDVSARRGLWRVFLKG